ncbi:hypothetical protein CLIM01_11702 [Colletotrichum limetticola]|uniref:Uncharacterized protein n=1 Tax=Colletotrichum limetticola TaxID=1209924 RepID=A0ABQ9PLF2_9PEZI|nr:hypothetical protein CLIM01_11702 [Colletotrichum limetticola]
MFSQHYPRQVVERTPTTRFCLVAPPQHTELMPNTEDVKRHWDETLAALYKVPASDQLRNVFRPVRDRIGDEATFVKHLKTVANMTGPGRRDYYDDSLLGLHHMNSFTDLFNEKHPKHRISQCGVGFGLCPRDWTNELDGESQRWVITYRGDRLFSEGLVALLCGPTTLDCGMDSQLKLWVALLLTVGDDVLQEVMPFEAGQFILTQQWHLPMDEAGVHGSLLHPFYDLVSADCPSPTARIHTRTFYNHRTYLVKHPAGMGRLQNVTQIDEKYCVFEPSDSQNLLSPAQLEQKLMHQYNAPQTAADLETFCIWDALPDRQHAHFRQFTLGDCSAVGKGIANLTFDAPSWEKTKAQRDEDAEGLHLVFNVERLLTCIRETMQAYRRGNRNEDFWFRARRLKEESSLS